MSKSTKKNEMGKGIRALLSNIESQEKDKSPEIPANVIHHTAEIPMNQIEANPFQPRKEFDQEQLNELKESIETFGIIQPITLRRLSSRKYQIISGERRWQAGKMAGLKTIPAFIREADDQGMLEMALLENIQRSDLNPLEIGVSYQRLIDECRLTHEQLSSRLGKKRSSITNYLRILKLPPSVQKGLLAQLISFGHAKVIAGMSRVEDQVYLFDQILTKSLSVRGTELLKDKLEAGAPVTRAKEVQEKHPEVRKMEDQLSDIVGRPVSILRTSKGKGAIKISFSSDKELNKIIESLIG